MFPIILSFKQAYGAFIDQSLPDFLPEVSTLRSIFTHHLDFNAVPRRNFFQYLRYFTEDERETEKLDDFLSPEGAVSSLTASFLPATQRRSGRALRVHLESQADHQRSSDRVPPSSHPNRLRIRCLSTTPTSSFLNRKFCQSKFPPDIIQF